MHLLTRSRRGGRRLVARGALAALLTVGLTVPAGTAAATTADPAGESFPGATGWIAAQLDDDSTAGELADAILAFAADGTAGDATADAAGALEAVAATAADNAGALAKLVLAANAAGLDTSDLDGFDAEAELRDTMATEGEDAGRFGGGTHLFVQSLAIMALATTDDGVPPAATAFLASKACDNGTFNFPGTCPLEEGDGNAANDVDVTALAAQALLAAGQPATDQVAWFLDLQAADGSFAAYADPNANSTALAAQTLRAAGYETEADEAAAFVASLQKGCDAPAGQRGAIATYPDADGSLWLATTQGVLATAGQLHELDATTSSAAPSTLECFDGAFCPTATGISVVVDFTTLDPDRDPVVACVTDVPEGASGLDLLEAAGFEPLVQDFGGDLGKALCAIDGLPELDEGECFDPSFDFWSYWNAERGGDWTEYQTGAGSSTPVEGTVEGFAWAGYPADPPRVSVPGFDEDPTDPTDPTDPADPTDPTDPEPPVRPTPPYDRGIDDACPGTYPRTFDDTAGSVHERAIRCLAAARITLGTGDGSSYSPRQDVTRAQLASFLVRTYERATGERLADGRDRFTDVRGSVHERNINALAAAGVIRGVGDGSSFAPNRTVTRGQMASLLDRTLDLLDDGGVNDTFPPRTDRDVFSDDDGSVHEPAIDRLAVQGVVQGRRDGSFGPQAGVTRDQLASFLARSIDLAVDAGIADPVG